ncbi:white protein, putative [Eimeria acervulina]|uniref:White protein, putative n=1 Tax=Eimeria acervulina TaxID=5801 RepID=U6GJH5_EIMAC|nr:white protein, putative [Eimeria acervulina]CDI79717.1 white protein, putative [Eimeria acervulina]
MAEPQEEFLRQLSSGMPPAGAGDCCEALNAAASDVVLRRFSIQSLKSRRSSVDKRSVSCMDGTEEAGLGRGEGISYQDSNEQNPTYERLKDLPFCPPVTITFKDVSLKVNVPKRFTGALSLPVLNQIACAVTPPQTKTLLQGVDGTVQPGEMVALMGASGAGKSTLLNVLSRRIVSNGGSVLFNGKSLGSVEVKRLCCFIQQSDSFYGFLTVQEHLDCVARLRTGQKKEQRSKLVDRLVELYGLTKVKDSRIGNLQMAAKRGISGGEKKRLNIATEMMTSPSVIFADEPTTGLDSLIAENVMSIFRLLADRGRTIICTIHQPSSNIFNMFTKVLLLSRGRLVFYGDREATLLYFSRLGRPCPPFTSVPEFLLELLVKQQLNLGEPSEDLSDLTPEKYACIPIVKRTLVVLDWQSIGKGQALPFLLIGTQLQVNPDPVLSSAATGTRGPADIETEPTKEAYDKYKPSWSEELFTLVHRSFISNSRNPRAFQARVGQTLVLAIIAGLIFLRLSPDNYLSRSVLHTFTSDKVLAIREYQSGLYRLSSYYCGKMIADFSLQMIFPVVFATIAWYMVGLNDAAVRWLLASVRFDDDPYIVHASSPNVRIYGDSVKHAGVLDLAAVHVAVSVGLVRRNARRLG